MFGIVKQFISECASALNEKSKVVAKERTVFQVGGIPYRGKTLTNISGKLFVDGKQIGNPEDKYVVTSVEVQGACESVNTMSGDVTVNGDVTGRGVETMSGDVTVGGNVSGSVSTMSGDIIN